MKILQNIILVALLFKIAACTNTRPLQYVHGSFDTARLSQYITKENVIQQGDLISISVYSDNPIATELYNLSNTSGYLVDNQGNIQFQGVGNLHVEGLTKQQLTELLNGKLTEFLKNPYFNIRFLNYKVTLLGEVTREGVYTVPSEKVNIFDAIGLAGGLGIYARRENVMIIREANGKREFARLDLTNPEVFNSPYYFLQQNDIVVVEQTRGKAVVNDQATIRNVNLVSTIISTLAIVYSILRQ